MDPIRTSQCRGYRDRPLSRMARRTSAGRAPEPAQPVAPQAGPVATQMERIGGPDPSVEPANWARLNRPHRGAIRPPSNSHLRRNACT